MTMGVAQSQIQRPGLYLAVLGGRTPQTHVELHDVRWVVGCCIDDTIPELKRQWFGHQKGLHLDSYVRIDCVDGYAVELTQSKSSDTTSDDSQPLRPKLCSEHAPTTPVHYWNCTRSVAWWPQCSSGEKSQAMAQRFTTATQRHLHTIEQVGGIMTAYRLWNFRLDSDAETALINPAQQRIGLATG